MAAQYRFLVLLLALVADGAPSWSDLRWLVACRVRAGVAFVLGLRPVTYSYAPDNMPIIQVRLVLQLLAGSCFGWLCLCALSCASAGAPA